MEENNESKVKNNQMFKYSIKYGLGLTVAFIVLHVFNYMNNLRFNFMDYLNYAVMLAAVILGAYNYRQKFLNGFISYGNCLGITMIIVGVSSFVFAVYVYLFYAYFDTEILAVIQRRVMDKMMQNPSIPAEQIDKIEMSMSFFFKPFFFSLSTLFNMLMTGAFFSLISSAFIKRKDNSFNGTFNQ